MYDENAFTEDDAKQKISEIILSLGILIDDLDMPIADFLTDSILFITLICEIESEFGVELPNEFLLYENLGSLNQLATRVHDLVKTDSSATF
jgi:acyl carrier protein